jgi:hypothetical protein
MPPSGMPAREAMPGQASEGLAAQAARPAAVVEARDLTRRFGSLVAVDHVLLKIATGEMSR